MHSYYVIIKIATNTTSGDSISVGLLAFNGKNFTIKFSDRKINAAMRLIDDNKLFGYFKKQIEERVKEENIKSSTNSNQLFNQKAFLSSDFFAHLKKSSNNLVQFSNPSLIKDIIGEKQFYKLFELFVDKFEEEMLLHKNKSELFNKNIETKLIHRIEPRVHTNITINAKMVPSIYFPFTFDCLGKNGAIVSVKAIDFNNQPQTIDKNLMRYQMLLPKLYDRYSKNNNRAFIIADEPEIKKSEAYNIWEIINSNPDYEVKNSEEVEMVAEFIEESNAQKFLKFTS